MYHTLNASRSFDFDYTMAVLEMVHQLKIYNRAAANGEHVKFTILTRSERKVSQLNSLEREKKKKKENT